MKRLVVALMLAAIVPAHADTDEQLDVWREITFTAPIPCSLACPYWLDTLNADVDGDGREDVFFSACTNPGGTGDELEGVGGVPYEEGTVYDDVLVGPRPDGARVLFVEIAPAVDWDMFICGENGREIPTCGSSFHLCQQVGPTPCEGPLPRDEIPLGCRERIAIQVAVDRRYILRAYNWSDPFPLDGRYCFSSDAVCGEAS